MDRRESIKSILVGSLASGTLVQGCAPGTQEEVNQQASSGTAGKYGRTAKEMQRDARINSEQFLTESEIDTIATLCDLILPGSDEYASASDAGVPQFLEFIVKDMPNHQLPLRGGVMWLDNFANETFGTKFTSCGQSQQKELLDQIAYPDEAKPELSQGVKFFTLMRNLTMTGFYTSEIGVKELGYAGNQPNVWDGVPADVLKKHDVEIPEWIEKCVDQERRMDVAEWDENGNLLT